MARGLLMPRGGRWREGEAAASVGARAIADAPRRGARRRRSPPAPEPDTSPDSCARNIGELPQGTGASFPPHISCASGMEPRASQP
eukprot:scaffold17150_cov102-Isochrysis_galbana.AAC.2